MSSKRRTANSHESKSAAIIGIGTVVAVLLIVALLLWWRSSPAYPEVSSPESLQLMRALYTACSSQNSTRLSEVERKVSEAEKGHLLVDAERNAFTSIIALARQGDWQSAAARSYRFAKDQIR